MAKKSNNPFDEEGYRSLLDDDVDFKNIDNEIKKLQNLKEEKKAVEVFKKEVKDHDTLKKHHLDLYDNKENIAINKKYYKLLKYSVIFIILIGIASLVLIYYLVDNGKFQDTVLCGNNACQECQECGDVNLSVSPVCEEQVCNPTFICNMTYIKETVIINGS